MVSLAIYMAGMLYIGYWSYKKTSDLSDYMLGGRGLGPAVTALSAGASDMSGWMLMGLPGAMYATGLSSVWISHRFINRRLCKLFNSRAAFTNIYGSSK